MGELQEMGELMERNSKLENELGSAKRLLESTVGGV